MVPGAESKRPKKCPWLAYFSRRYFECTHNRTRIFIRTSGSIPSAHGTQVAAFQAAWEAVRV
jgi:hypothetical protein